MRGRIFQKSNIHHSRKTLVSSPHPATYTLFHRSLPNTGFVLIFTKDKFCETVWQFRQILIYICIIFTNIDFYDFKIAYNFYIFDVHKNCPYISIWRCYPRFEKNAVIIAVKWRLQILQRRKRQNKGFLECTLFRLNCNLFYPIHRF